jgi:hypothetical protein
MTICHRRNRVPSTRPFRTTGSIPFPLAQPTVPVPVPQIPTPGRTSGTCRHRTTSVLVTNARASASADCQVSALPTRRTSLQPVGCPTWQHFGCSNVGYPGWPPVSAVGVWAHRWAHWAISGPLPTAGRGSSRSLASKSPRRGGAEPPVPHVLVTVGFVGRSMRHHQGRR